MRTEIPEDLDGRRADFVVARLCGVSRARARELVERGVVLVDGAATTPATRVRAGSTLQADLPQPEAEEEAQPVPFGVLYEDEHLAVIDKPAGVVTHRGAGTGATIASGVLHRWPGVRGVGDEGRWGIVHRLDKQTSGAMIVALSHDAFGGLRAAVRQRRVGRRYLALVHGGPSAPTGTIDAPLGPDPQRRGRRRVDAGGKPARTHFRTVGAAAGMTLLAVTLDSGRTHQIRVHLAAVGLPIAGDHTYGKAAGSPRPFLHAAEVGFDHPVTGERLDVASPLPEDLRAVLNTLGLPTPAI
jgi:23S rRNA pseudouridine1911/1915/1917 synthase